ncbi:ABC transporter substrate-binding protein [Lacrimispora sp. 210928-DFI.3.58]|uniref:ABC transporter substrate-binding protein n=1 Tax=Lacrimispora sp. 210928-DFI.3.58 TaxID=2883214 RepID=UPI001D07466D|nr:ABC transporter substrate-binding protein [Lacrimispora sp. 210928-DFI.3.58]MCB7320620.1 ABC transporter substrate-binding protein [Lacrimispora sp. 210928-DFI.3.58]
MKKSLFMLLAAALTMGMLAGCSSQDSSNTSAETNVQSEVTANGGAGSGSVRDSLVVAVPEPPVYLDPHIQTSTATFRVTTQIYDRLTQMDENLQIIPMLAESWDVVDEYTTQFHLRPGVKFHNGETMNAEDVKFSLERCMASDGVNYNYKIIESVEIVDDMTVVVKTKTPFNAMPTRLSLDAASIVSKKAVEEYGDDFNIHPVGSGPFKLSSWGIGGDCVLVANEDYWAGPSPIKTLTFRTIPEAINRTIGLETGEVDIAYDIDPIDKATIEENADLRLLASPSCRVIYLGSCVKNEILSDVKVRKAIAYAVNKSDYINIVFGGDADIACNTMLCNMLFGYMPDTVSYDTDLDKARQLMTEAGYPDGFDITLTVMDTQEYRTAAVVIQSQLKEIGINVTVESMDNASFLQYVAEGKQALFMYEKVASDTDSMLRTQYHTDSLGLGGNRHHWTDPEVDNMLDKASSSLDDNERQELYTEIQTIVADAVPLYPLAIPYLYIGTQADVAGLKVHPTNCHSIYGTSVAD